MWYVFVVVIGKVEIFVGKYDFEIYFLVVVFIVEYIYVLMFGWYFGNDNNYDVIFYWWFVEMEFIWSFFVDIVFIVVEKM